VRWGAALIVLAVGARGGHRQAQKREDGRGNGVAYQCEDGRKVVARFGTDRAVLDLDGKRADLIRVRAASGVKYADASTVFWTRSNDAMLETPGTMTRCLREDR
jgi:membrane-bound inhibitor of C-type lysozyme